MTFSRVFGLAASETATCLKQHNPVAGENLLYSRRVATRSAIFSLSLLMSQPDAG
jgi:hypothetical protein